MWMVRGRTDLHLCFFVGVSLEPLGFAALHLPSNDDDDDDDGVLHRSRGDSKLPTTRLKRH